MKASEDIKKFMKSKEGLKLSPYLCPAGVPTIGYGATFYENGAKVTMKDAPITQQRADQLFNFHLSFFEKDVNALLTGVTVKQCQFDALLDFAYNVGTDIDADSIPEGLGDSTLLKLVKANPENPAIEKEFLKWNKANGFAVKGLTIRRMQDAAIYFGNYGNGDWGKVAA